MADYYGRNIIPIILNRFNVKNIVISGISDKKTINYVLDYCKDNNSSYVAIDSQKNSLDEVICDFTLNVLPNFRDYDAIFLNDDPNWYTVFNELNIIKNNNNEFPLVFIGHNVFPHKRRDSYINPDIIPKEFLNDYAKELFYNDVKIDDDFFHAVDEKTSKNGVLTAIEDFISKNSSIGIMDFKFLNGITILYSKNSISKIRIGRITEEIEEYKLDDVNFSDKFAENKILSSNLAKLNILSDNSEVIESLKIKLSQKERIISDFEYQIKLHNNELSLKDSEINSFDSELELKETRIKHIESILFNRDTEIMQLNNKLNHANDEITYLKNTLSNKFYNFDNVKKELNNKINLFNSRIQSLESLISINKKEELELSNRLQLANNQIKLKNDELNLFKQRYNHQLFKLDAKEYCISCYREEIDNNHLEIEYLKNDSFTKKFLSPFAYVYLILKSNPKDLSINLKLYNAIKNSKCFDIGFYLNNNQDIQESNWCKYFSPELHYVCVGFDEKRKFNRKYFNCNSKKELLDYILNCKY